MYLCFIFNRQASGCNGNNDDDDDDDPCNDFEDD